MTGAEDVLYDDPAFFERHHEMRQRGAGLNEDLERPALLRLLPDVAGADVLDIGSGAESLALAPECLDLVVSSLALHYVADYDTLIRRIAGWLRPGGQLTYSVEHPICTARDPMTGWLAVGEGTVWPVDDYARETPRAQQWLGTAVTKHHRRLATLIGAVLAAGLILTGIDEPYPDEQALGRRPDLADHRRRPPLLIISARKPYRALTKVACAFGRSARRRRYRRDGQRARVEEDPQASGLSERGVRRVSVVVGSDQGER